MVGVSPAYFFSSHGPSFGPEEICQGLPFLAESGYDCFQAEVVYENGLDAWSGRSAAQAVARAGALGLRCSVFVAHFLGESFSAAAAIREPLHENSLERALAIASSFPGNGIFAVPLMPYKEARSIEGPGRSSNAEHTLEDKLGLLLEHVGGAGLHLALELVPGNALGGSAEFLKLAGKPGFGKLRLLLDTGHFWAMGEAVGALPAGLVSRIEATHLCDNDGVENLSLCPGDGTVPFAKFLDGLVASGYTGSFDVEIVCSPGDVRTEYRKAASRLRPLLPAEKPGAAPIQSTVKTVSPELS